jgi:phosphatidylserine decarboxylase
MLFLSSLASRLLFVCRAVLGWPKWLSHHFSAHRMSKLNSQDNIEPFHPVVADFKRLIEEDADIYMGFHQIFDEIPDQPQYQDDPTGNPQVCIKYFLRIIIYMHLL